MDRLRDSGPGQLFTGWRGPTAAPVAGTTDVIEQLLLILDEPTTALDAETEHDLFERYAASAADGGAHEGLIRAGGPYRELYTIQQQAYR